MLVTHDDVLSLYKKGACDYTVSDVNLNREMGWEFENLLCCVLILYELRDENLPPWSPLAQQPTSLSHFHHVAGLYKHSHK